MTHLADLPLADVAAAIRRGSLTATALVEAHIERIANRDPVIGAFVQVSKDEALETAASADAALVRGEDTGPLHGIPFAVKDVIDVAGWPVRFGSARFRDRIAQSTAPSVQRLIDAGAIPLGLVATYELATVGPDPTSLYPQPRNPWKHNHITGGSSSGSAAAVASGMVRLALGTDTGGSIRSPAAYCGAVGLKPTYGMVPMAGVIQLSPSFDVVGPLGQDVADVAALFAALTGRHLPESEGVADAVLGYARDWCDDPAAHPALQGLMDDAASALSIVGAEIREIRLPDYNEIETAAGLILYAEKARSFCEELRTEGAGMGDMAWRALNAGAKVTQAQERFAREVSPGIRAGIDQALQGCDALILPTVMTPAPSFASFANAPAAWTPMRTIPFNLSGHPALSVPMGFADGLPMGLQIVARHGAEETVLRVAAAFEAATDHGAGGPHIAADSVA